MKKRMIAIALVVFTVFLQGCTSAKDTVSPSGEKKAPHPDFAQMKDTVAEKEDGTIDLRNLNGNMIYAQVYNMMIEPQKYEGKTIKIRGQYYGEPDPNGKDYYHFVFIADAAACCQQGIEFVRDGDFRIPEDYPALEQKIEVEGVWGKYQDGENTFWRLNSAKMTIIEE